MSLGRQKSFLPGLFLLPLLVTWGCAVSGPVGSPAECGGLDKKMSHQFALYDKATLWLASYFKAGHETAVKPILRNDWEARLRPSPGCQLTAKELEELNQRRQKKIINSRKKSYQLSKFDLQAIRTHPKKLRQFCSALPKGGLIHIHPTGTVRREMVAGVLKEFNPKVDGPDLVERTRGYKLYPHEVRLLKSWPKGLRYLSASKAQRQGLVDLFFLADQSSSHDFSRFDTVFILLDWLRKIVGKPQFDRRVYHQFLGQAKAHNVQYVEFTRSTGSRPDFGEKYPQLAEQFYKDYGIVVRWNSAFNRTRQPEQNLQRLNSLWAHWIKFGGVKELVGIDLLGDERETPFLERGQSVYGRALVAQRGNYPPKYPALKLTAHAGEMGDVRNVRDALIFGARRIGHGVLLTKDPLTWEWAVKKEIAIENSQVSNWKLGNFPKDQTHPFLSFLRSGLRVSLSTDDEGIFVSSIVDECVAAVENTDISYFELKQLSFNSLLTAFVEEEVKNRQLKELEARFSVFEKSFAKVFTAFKSPSQ